MRGPPPITIPNGYPCSPRKNRRSSTAMAMSCVSSRRRMTAAARCGATPMAAMPSGTDSCRHTIRSNLSAIQYGDGDVLRIVETPHDGSRTVWRDADGRYAERYGQLPSYYTIESSGGTHAKGQAGKVLCLTFDDRSEQRY